MQSLLGGLSSFVTDFVSSSGLRVSRRGLPSGSKLRYFSSSSGNCKEWGWAFCGNARSSVFIRNKLLACRKFWKRSIDILFSKSFYSNVHEKPILSVPTQTSTIKIFLITWRWKRKFNGRNSSRYRKKMMKPSSRRLKELKNVF